MGDGRIFTVGVVGCGIGRSHIAEGYRKHPDKFLVIAICDIDEARRQVPAGDRARAEWRIPGRCSLRPCTAPPIARDRDGAADDGVKPRHVHEGYLLRPAVAAGQACGLVDPVGKNTARTELLEAAAQSGRRYEDGDATAQRLGPQRALR